MLIDRKKKIQYLKLLREKKKRLLRSSYYEFVKYFWDTIIQDEFVDNWHIKYLCDEVQKVLELVIAKQPKEYDLWINVPPGTSKSTIVTVMMTPWLWIRAPWAVHISNSYSAELSHEHSMLSRDIVKSQKYQELFGEVTIRRDKDNKSTWSNTQKGGRIAVSTGGSVTGRHAHVITNDDPINPKRATSKPYREEAKKHLGTLSTRKKNKETVPTIGVMQRLHQDDPTGYVLSQSKSVKHICLPGEYDATILKPIELADQYVDGLLDAKRLSREVLEDLKIDLGSYGYAGQIQQSPAPAEGGIIKRAWIGTYELSEIQGVQRHFVVDTAQTENEKNAPTVILCFAMRDRTVYIVNVTRKWLKSTAIENQIKTDVLMYGDRNSKVYIEPKSTGPGVITHLHNETDINVIDYIFRDHTGKVIQQQDKELRVYGWAPKAEAGRLKVLNNAPWTSDYIEELVTFPASTFKDQTDTTSMAMELASQVVYNYEGGFV